MEWRRGSKSKGRCLYSGSAENSVERTVVHFLQGEARIALAARWRTKNREGASRAVKVCVEPGPRESLSVVKGSFFLHVRADEDETSHT
ncbi:hypothetical protein Naga_100001g79 [Nannochloropsis gaditana]|uniref:Uncharacterized protein n=1 Tax=Nannochloropsis gaditana TaxID=72520 RepID=W7TT15_9STRA|nr:hypothetical protein Naga_100001g79 [Nannochloropsis gaditana]